MFRPYALLPAWLVLGALAACSPDGGPTRPAAATSPAASAAPDTAALRRARQQFRVHYNAPVDLDSSAFYCVPVSVLPLEAGGRDKLLSSSSYDGYGSSSGNIIGTCYNVLFFEKETGRQRPLLPHSRFVLAEIHDANEPDSPWPYLFYTIIKADTNRDGEQNPNDASCLFVSDRAGRQLHQLTPDSTQLGSRYIIPKTSVLLVEVRPDTDHNGQFNNADVPYWLRFDLRNLGQPPARHPNDSLSNEMQQQMLLRQIRSK
ncbi:hypothetical protein [Hymenobacter aerophilus]|uniref:hypothetical protein n=1 Tax=Hymenobacter aerophilus TaxID=119644 RepID=UPI0012F7E456|nr:hypothetical protein [Hymenobacter aerophilus]